MKDENKEHIESLSLSSVVPQRFLNYAMYVAMMRALPDVKDGLKPVHRRILFSMRDLGLSYNKPYKKSARTVGDVLGRLHPHGDASVYEAMVILAQDFSTRYPLVDMEGNTGSIDGDPAAAMRYTLSRLSRYGQAMMNDLNKNSVDFKDNYDGEEKEPTVLSSLLPTLLLNGAFGIAVGLTTKIPSHNIKDVYNACYYIINQSLADENIDIEEVIKIIQAPDFATGGTIIGLDGVKEAYRTGKGKITVRSKYEIEENKNSSSIVISEIPYKVNKSVLIDSIRDLMKDEKNKKGEIIKKSVFSQIKEIRDESDKDGMRIVVELKKDENPQIVVNNLIKFTKFQDNFSCNMLALVDNVPKQLNILELLESFLSHCAEVIVRRSQFDLNKCSLRINIVNGIIKCLNDEELLQQVIAAIRFSENEIQAIINLGFNKEQAEYLADIKIRTLSNASKEKLTEECEALNAEINKLNDIINNDKVLLETLKEEFIALEKQFGDERRTDISLNSSSIEEEDLIREETLVVTYTTDGIIKAVEEAEFKSQKKGGKGVKGTKTKEDEIIKFMFTTSSKDDLLFFTSIGRCHILKAYKIGKSSKGAKGRSINNYLNLDIGEKIISVLNTNVKNKDNYLLMLTKDGIIKKLSLEQLSSRMSFTKVISFKDEDHLIQTLLVKDNDSVVMATKEGKASRINCDCIRPTGRSAMGVKAMTISDKDEMVDMCVVTDEDLILTITQLGLAKKTKAKEWTVRNRGGKGMIAHDISNKTGDLTAILTIEADNELFIATEKGIITRIKTDAIRTLSRSSKGAKSINLSVGDKVASVSVNKLKEDDNEIEIDDNLE